VFSAVTRLIAKNPALAASARMDCGKVVLSSGSELRPLATGYADAAGPNQGLSSWDEVWAYESERAMRLWEELTPVPTRKNSVRIVTTYAGFEGESALLRDLYKAGVGPEEHAEGQGVRVHPTLPLWLNAEARLLVYWDHEARMPWQHAAYYAGQKRQLRASAYLRLHENRWTTSESIFITPELWDGCVVPELRPLMPTKQAALFLGVDAGLRHDWSAVCGVHWVGDRLALALHRIWRPSAVAPLDLETTIEAFLREVHTRYQVSLILCDPYQLARSVATLKAASLPIEEFPQTTQNTTRMGQALFDLLNGRNLAVYPSAELREQALHTVAIESPRGWRIAKERASKKIDAIVALAMACVAAIDGKPSADATTMAAHFAQSLADRSVDDEDVDVDAGSGAAGWRGWKGGP
jgi:hypothetical protein